MSATESIPRYPSWGKDYQKAYRERVNKDPVRLERKRAQRRASDRTESNSRRARLVRERKQHILDLLGGKCRVCGYDAYIGVIDLHETEKLFYPNPGTFLKSNKRFQQLLDDIHVLVPLCRNCHAEYHAGLVDLPKSPGKASAGSKKR